MGSAPAWSQCAAVDGEVGVEGGVSDRYELVGELGRGGMGRVLLVRDRALDRLAARKELPADRPELSARLWREARLGARLDHPNIVPIYDAGVDGEGRPWFVMRYVRGRTLREVVHGETTEGRTGLVRAMLQAVEAVSFAHARGVVHRDITPDNVLIGPMGDVQVADWGLARDLDAPEAQDGVASVTSGGTTRVGAILGTVPWLAPEQARGEAADARSDVYALGALLRYVLTSTAPVPDASDASLARIASGRIDPLPEDVPRALAAVIGRAMSADAGDRYADAGELAGELAAWLDGRTVLAYEYSAMELLLRLLRRWRLPLSVASGGLLAASVAGVVGWQNTAHERDRAVRAETEALEALATSDAHLAARLAVHARRALRVGAFPEAETLAAHAMRLAPSEQALGVLAKTAWGAPLILREEAELPVTDVRSVRPLSDGGALVLSAERVIRLAADLTPLWEQPLSLRRAGAEGERILVQDLGERLGWMDGATGAVRWTSTVDHYTTALLVGDGGPGVAVNQGAVQIVGLAGEQRLCGIEPILAGAARGAQKWVGCRDGRVLEIDAEGEARPAWRIPIGAQGVSEPRSLLVLPGGDLIVGALRDVVLRLDGRTGDVLWRRTLGVGVVEEIQGDDEVIVASVERGGPLLLDAETGALRGRLPAQDAGSVQLRRDAEGVEIVSWAARRAVWRLGAGSLPAQVPLRRGASRLSVAPDGATVALSLADGFVERWSLEDGGNEWVQSGPAVFKGLAWGPEGLLAVQAWTRGGVLWPSGGAPVPLQLSQSRRAGFRPNLGYWVLAYGEGLFRWAGELHPLTGPGDYTDAIPYGDGILLQHADGRLLLMEEGEPKGVGWAPAGSVIAAGPTGQLAVGGPHGLSVHPSPGAAAVASRDLPDVTALAFHPSGELLAVGTRRGEVALLEVQPGGLAVRYHLGAHDERVSAVDFTPDGASLLTASWDATMCRLSVDPGRSVNEAVGRWGVDVWRAAAWVDTLP